MMGHGSTLWLLLVPAWLCVLLAAAGVWLIVYDGRSGRIVGPGGFLRRLPAAGVLATLLVLMANPVRVTEGAGAPSLRLAVVVDTSASMRTADVRGQSRGEAAVSVLTSGRLASARQRARVRLLGVDHEAHEARSLDDLAALAHASGVDASLLDSALSAWLSAAEVPPDAMLLLTDGRDTQSDGFDRLAAAARRAGTRIWAVVLGGSVSPPRLRLELVDIPSRVDVGRRSALVLRAARSGSVPDSVRMRVTEADADETDHELIFGEGRQVLWRVPIGPFDTAGEWELSINTAEPDVELAGGPLTVFVEVSDQPVRVLWVQGQPDWDSRFVAMALREHRDIVLRRLTLPGGEGRRERDRKVIREALAASDADADVDVVVLGRGAASLLDAALVEQLRVGVEAGTLAVLLFDAQGDWSTGAYTALHPAAAIGARGGRPEVAAVRPTEAGRRHPWFGQMSGFLDEGMDAAAACVTHSDAMPRMATLVLAEGDGRPVLMEMPLGAGCVMALEAFDLWRWRMRRPAENQGSRAFFDAFWGGLLHYLAEGGESIRGAVVSLEVHPAIVEVGQEVTVHAAARGGAAAAISQDTIPLFIEAPDGASWTATMNESAAHESIGGVRRFTGAFTAGRAGVYRVSSSSGSPRHIAAREDDIERFDVAARPAALADLAEATGGELLGGEADPWPRLSRMLDRLAVQRGDLSVQPRLHRGWTLGLIVLSSLAAWILEDGGRRT